MVENDDPKNPTHYQGKIQPLDAVEEWSKHWPPEVTFHLGCATKYIGRCGRKDDPRSEITKAIRYLERALDRLAPDVETHHTVAAKPRPGWYGRERGVVFGPYDSPADTEAAIRRARGYEPGELFEWESYVVDVNGSVVQ